MPSAYIRVHVVTGCFMLGFFALMGVALEAFHGFKLPFFLDAENETRRLLLRLSHSHGVLLGLCQFAAAFICDRFALQRSLSTLTLHLSSLLLPVGFLLGGISLAENGNDPGYGVLLVPPAGVLLVFSFCSLGWQVFSAERSSKTKS